MDKKEYAKPEMEMVKIRIENLLLSASQLGIYDESADEGLPVMGKKNSLIYDFEDDEADY